LIGLISTSIVLVIALIKFLKSKSNYYTRIFKRIAIIGGFGLILFVVPELSIIKLQYKNHPLYIKAYEEYLKSPQSLEAKDNLDIEYHRAKMSKEEFDWYMEYRENKEKLK
jgi:hypothetical protein